MRIGIDVDGVLADIETYMWDYGSKYLVEWNMDPSIDHNEYNTLDVFGWDEEKDNMFWSETFKDYCINIPVRRFAAEVIHKLRKQGHLIYIITARGCNEYKTEKEKKKSDKILINWLKNNKIKYDKLIFTGDDKLEQCLTNGIDIMIEDCPANLKQISKKIPMICMHSNYNAKVRGKNIVRCHTWYEIYNIITNLKIPKI